MFSIASLTPYQIKGDVSEITKVEIPFSKPTVGLSISFPLLESYSELTKDQIKELNKKSKISYDGNAIQQIQAKEISPYFTEEDYLED